MKMPFYDFNNTVDAFWYLLREANPDLDPLINEETVELSAPSVLTPEVSGRNTEITLTPVSGSTELSGSVTLRYTRLRLDYLSQTFEGASTGIRKIYGSGADLNINTDMGSFGIGYRNKIASKLGIIWDTIGDLNLSVNLSAYTATQNALVLSAASTNLCYVGNTTINMLVNTTVPINVSLSNRVLVDDISLSENPDVFYKLLAIKPDATYIDTFRTAFGNADTFSAVTITAGHQPFFNAVNALTGLNLRADVAFGVTAYAIGGQSIIKQLPTSSAVQMRHGGSTVDADINTRFKNLIGSKWARVAIVGGTYTGWQKNQFILPLFVN